MNAAVAALVPPAVLLVGAIAAVVFERLLPADERAKRSLAAAFAFAAATSALVLGPGDDALSGAIRRDAAAITCIFLLAVTAAAALLLETADPAARDNWSPALTLTATAGAILVATAGDLVLLLIALEVVLASQLAIVGRCGSRDAARTYFLAAGTASTLLALGVVLILAATGASGFGALSGATSVVGRAGVAMVLAALACVAALAPLHLWSTTTAATLPPALGLFAVSVPRIAAGAVLLRCGAAITSASDAAVDWRACVAVLAAATLVTGAIGALTETSLRRVLAYLSLAYVGQLMVAAAAGVAGSAAFAFALVAFVPLHVAGFAVIAMLPSADAQVDELRGIARRRPAVATASAVALFGLAGLPPTVGFFARFAIFESAVEAQLAWLMFVAAGATVASAAAAARVALTTIDAAPGGTLPSRTATGLALASAVVVLAGGIVPGPLLELARGLRF